MPTVRDRNVRKLRRMRKKARARMKGTLKELSTSKEAAKTIAVLNLECDTIFRSRRNSLL